MIHHSERAELLKLIDEMLSRLDKDLPQEEIDAGWSESSRQTFLKFFKDLKSRLENGQLFTEEELIRMNIARAMDYSGIVGGDLLELGSRIWIKLYRAQGFQDNDLDRP